MFGQLLFVDALAVFLLASGVAHILLPLKIDSWLGRVATVRTIGLLLLLLALPCFLWRGWYFLALGLLLGLSGGWRLLFAENSIRAQRLTYPRWVHGCLLLLGALGVWGIFQLAMPS